MCRCLCAPGTTLLQPETLATKADSFEQGEIWGVKRFGQDVLNEGLFGLVPSFIDDNQIGLIDCGIDPRINEGRLLREFIKEGVSYRKQFLAMLRLHSDKHV